MGKLILIIICGLMLIFLGLCQYSYKWHKFRYWYLSKEQLKKAQKSGKYFAPFFFIFGAIMIIIGLYKYFTGAF